MLAKRGSMVQLHTASMAPDTEATEYEMYFFACTPKWKNVEVSRQTINNVLKKHKRNNSPYKSGKKNWNYFRAKSPNDLWQMDVE